MNALKLNLIYGHQVTVKSRGSTVLSSGGHNENRNYIRIF